GPYRVPHLRVVGRSYFTNKVPAGAFRSLGRAQTTWGYESHYDSIARKLGLDPVAFRLKNFLQRGERLIETVGPLTRIWTTWCTAPSRPWIGMAAQNALDRTPIVSIPVPPRCAAEASQQPSAMATPAPASPRLKSRRITAVLFGSCTRAPRLVRASIPCWPVSPRRRWTSPRVRSR